MITNQPQQAYPLAGVYPQPTQFLTSRQMGGIPLFQFNGNKFLTINDENRFLELAYKGVASARMDYVCIISRK
ncbi:hypothetical protein FACS1894132_12280 [Clostridia bacterium]|nr:hypothetical protein FACS1894132_12280 [Clostridia bacterium]